MRGNSHVRFLGEKGAVMPLTYPMAKLQELRMKINNRKDDAVDFHTMGIDHIFVDECHYQNFLIFLFDILNILKFSIFFI